MTAIASAFTSEGFVTERFGEEIEKLGEMARRLRAKLANCYVEIKRYTASVTAEEKKNPEFRKRTRRRQTARRSRKAGREVIASRS